jgi:uncharacterized YigZ family protein
VLGSRFFGRAVGIADREAIDNELTEIRKQYHDATHWCSAFRLGYTENPEERGSDAGEPQGTAGTPILREIQHRDLFNVLVIVTRYFGGTKLGTGGLARAYSECAALALDAAVLVERELRDRLSVNCSYDDMSIVYHVARKYSVRAESDAAATSPRFLLKVSPLDTEHVIAALREESANRIQIENAGRILC